MLAPKGNLHWKKGRRARALVELEEVPPFITAEQTKAFIAGVTDFLQKSRLHWKKGSEIKSGSSSV